MITNKILDRITDKILGRITDKILDRITDKILDRTTNRTSKLQMLITFATIVRLRPTICQNTHNSEENPWENSKGIWPRNFPKKRL